MEQKDTNYELSFWFSSRLDEKEIGQKFDNLLKQLKDFGALIIFSELPQLKQLAYPVKKENNAYFGYIQFKFSKGSLSSLEEKLRLDNDVLRFMIFRIEPKEKQQASSRQFSKKPILKKQKSEEEKKEEKTQEKEISLEELDEKLNEILKEQK